MQLHVASGSFVTHDDQTPFSPFLPLLLLLASPAQTATDSGSDKLYRSRAESLGVVAVVEVLR